MYNFDQKILAWDAIPSPKNSAGAVIPGTIKYQVWSKSTVPDTTGTKVGGEISAIQLSMTFPAYTEVYPGVQAVFYPTATPTVAQTSKISWSTDAAACAGGVTFGVLYLPVIDAIKNLRMQ